MQLKLVVYLPNTCTLNFFSSNVIRKLVYVVYFHFYKQFWTFLEDVSNSSLSIVAGLFMLLCYLPALRHFYYLRLSKKHFFGTRDLEMWKLVKNLASTFFAITELTLYFVYWVELIVFIMIKPATLVTIDSEEIFSVIFVSSFAGYTS